MWYFIVFVLGLAAGVGGGLLWGKKKIKPIIAVLKDKTLTPEQKVAKILEIL